MNHDIAHCKNEDCRDKYKCYRYAAYKEIVEKSIDGYYSFYFNNKDVTCREECEIPWIKNESYKQTKKLRKILAEKQLRIEELKNEKIPD